MGLFKRKSSKPDLQPCPRCSQMLPRDALDCPMCGLDLRETYVAPASPSGDTA